MLEKYYETPLGGDSEKHQRLIAVNAALEIAKAAASGSDSGVSTALYDVKTKIDEAADAIQAAINK
ncbi:hypothetical protein [Serratia liquefaciens]|uniref:Uncharacterized protein n=1 Tax=Serratia liquefaciens TaxID=614 RepID=A0A515CWA5_SERLI|nr:hypothetical protein [Serratia liquefaciens]QDL32390.1 hypothetical protein EGO53_11550 [Serratia liquefaciens]